MLSRWQDLRYGFRVLLRSPGLTVLLVITVALGIGANATIFSVVNAVLLRPLPYPNSDRIVQISDTREMRGTIELAQSFPKFSLLHDQTRAFAALAAFSPTAFHLSGSSNQEGPVQVDGVRASRDFFHVLGVSPLLGRTFLDEEDRAGGNHVAVISYALWRNRFASDRNLIGRAIGVDGESTTVTGVMPPNFAFPSGSDIWLPRPFESTFITRRQVENGAGYLSVIGLRAPGVEIRQAQTELDALNRQYNSGHPGFTDLDHGILISPLREQLIRNIRPTLLVLLGAVGFVLLIASGNVANLLLARAIARGKEVAIRAALGASRSRLLVQFLTESILLSAVGAALGLLLSFWSIRLVTKLSPSILPRAGEIRIDGAVLFFTIAITFLTGIIFGLGPAIHSSRRDLNEALKTASRSLTGGSGSSRLRGLMVVSEVALAAVLLTGAGLLARSFSRLSSVDPGFRPQRLLTMKLGLSPGRYSQAIQQSRFYDQVLARVEELPGVRDASVTSVLPLSGYGIAYFFHIEGRPSLGPAKDPTTFLRIISPEYFHTMSIPMLKGRAFTAADDAGTPKVAIINETMAHRFWPNDDPLGQRLTYSREAITVEIAGVVGDVKFTGLDAGASLEEMYVPYRQRPWLTMWLIARGSGDPVNLTSAIRHEILAMGADQPVSDVRTMEEVISDSVAQPRLRAMLIGSFAALALVLAGIGIFGIVAWSVSERTHEIGVRMALGARPSSVLSMLARQAFVLIGTGQILGLAGAWALTRVLSRFLFGVSPEDPLTFVGVNLLLGAAALIACLLAARRATRIDPVIALRDEP